MNSIYYKGCVFQLAIHLNDSSLCNKLSKKDWDGGRDSCYSKVAMNTNKYELCEKIEKQSYKDACFSLISVALRDLKLCEKAIDRGYCYQNLAFF